MILTIRLLFAKMKNPDDMAAKILDLLEDSDMVKSIGKSAFRKCENLKYIGLFATGYNNIDIEYARELDITVCNAGSYSTDAVAQHTFALILDHYRRSMTL